MDIIILVYLKKDFENQKTFGPDLHFITKFS